MPNNESETNQPQGESSQAQVSVETPAADAVGREEFNTFRDDVNKKQDRMLDLLEGMSKTKESTSVATPQAQAEMTQDRNGGPDSNEFLPPKYRAIFEKYFDPNDGFTARLAFPEIDTKGQETGGMTFIIVVPDAFSNVEAAHKDFYKHDVRTVAIMPHMVARGIEEWCKRVARNLKYDKRISLKDLGIRTQR